MRRFAILVAAALAASGCLATPDAPQGAEAAAEPAAPPAPPQAVIALVDTGINPYHIAFRDNSALAFQHPSTYLPGYPEDAIALPISLDKDSLADARGADKAIWESVKPETLYWFPGTKIVGAYSASGPTIFSTGHGTMTASRAAANQYSLCPECRIVAVQGFTGPAVLWAANQPWIDVQSNSWSPLVVFQQADAAQEPGLASAFEKAAAKHLVFGSAGNGAMGKGGVVGHPSFTRSTSGPRGVVSMGGHDNGDVILWSGSWPHAVADACDNWAAVGNSLDQYGPGVGGGTSSASPYGAGEAGRIVLEARRLLGDDGSVGAKDGILARGEAGAITKGPLSDGSLTISEVRTLLMKTAVARPVRTLHDGDNCGPASPYNTYPIAWKDIPANLPTYYFIGYGQISEASLALALEVLSGQRDMPSRPLEDQWHAYAETLRNTYNGLPH